MADSRAPEDELGVRRRRKSDSELDSEEKVTSESDVPSMRRIRIERVEGNTTTRRSVATPKMSSESHATLRSEKSGSTHRRRKSHHHHSGKEEGKHRRRRNSTSKDESPYVYGSPLNRPPTLRANNLRIRKPSQDIESTSSDAESTQSDPVVEVKPRKRKIKIVYVDDDDRKYSKSKEYRSTTNREGRVRHSDAEKIVRRSRATPTRRQSAVEMPQTSTHRG